MLEVGKQYEHAFSRRTVEIVYAGKQIAVGKTIAPGTTDADPDDEVVIRDDQYGNWVPYVPEIVKSIVVDVMMNTESDDVWFSTRTSPNPAPCYPVAVKRLMSFRFDHSSKTGTTFTEVTE
jgi:hypothetical protein